MEKEKPRFFGAQSGMAGASRAARFARHLGLALGLGLFALPGVAPAASTKVAIKGKVTGTAKLLNLPWNEAKDPNLHRYTFREPSPTVRPDARTLTGLLPKELCVVALSGEKAAPAAGAMRMAVGGGRTSPVTLVVAEGQQIQFENQDPFPHKLYDTGSKGLTPVETAAYKNRGWTPPGPGKYEIRDQATPSLRSWIVVEPRAAGLGYPDRRGDFAMEIEPGKYKLRGYFNGEPVGSELEVTVAPGPAEQPLKGPLVVGEAPPPAGGAGK
ncbi:MAG: hypothetical protein U0359_36940 [Byssovorax sp.]